MRTILAVFLSLILIPMAYATDSKKEKPVQHLKLADVTSMAEAKKVFIESGFAMSQKHKLDSSELQEIHIITYSLEKGVAYFVENLSGEQKTLAEEMAVVVENIHLNSENNRKEETQKELAKYFEMANTFVYTYWQLK